ncbi:MAG TPA: hypothetical protein G4N96_10130 [Chloroflexi bacterium]|nr:hypothetical protein [Chloroflexota bacterium]
MKKETTSNYLACLLRLWRENGNSPWRVTVEDASTGERRGFADLKTLFAFLEKQTGGILLPSEDDSGDLNSG